MTDATIRPRAAPSPELIDRLSAIVGAEHALTDADLQLPYLREWRDLYTGRTPLVLRPGSTAEVSQIMALAHEAGAAIVPQGGNTGLVGGQVPFETGDEIVLSLARLRAVRTIDPAATSITVEAGLTLSEVHALAEEAGRLFPLSLPSEGTCQIGGVLATNAGGAAVLAYGNARNLCLGLEVVLADGRVWDGLRTLRKDNTGYDLRDLFIGSEGTLGIITAAVLRLLPRPAEKATAFVALADLEKVLEFFRLAEQSAGERLTAFEFMARRALEFVLRHVPGARDPFAEAHPWYVLIEMSGLLADGTTITELEELLAAGLERNTLADAVIARSLQQAGDLWRLREEMSDAQKHEGGSIKHDVSVPVPRMPEFIARAGPIVEAICPGARPVPFGHFGDGNVHYNVSQPPGMDKARYLDLWPRMNQAVHALVVALDGSISAEHGIGRLKRAELARVKSPVELDVMRAIKAALDPKGILNPGKLL